MITFPNCKINLGLSITGKREDGYHNLETVFYPVPLKDALEIITAPPEKAIPTVEFSASGLTVDGTPENNLCVKAWHLLKNDFPSLPSVRLHLHKVIPMGAGLGGGSADGAFTLQLLNNTYKLGLTNEQLISYALQLGSDCPFFILNTPCFATGRGEIMQPIDLALSGYTFVLVNPGIHVSTGWAFANITPQQPAVSIKDIIQQPVATWKNRLINDFEAPVMQQYPTIQQVREQLYDAGAIYASMTGSGSTVFGIFDKTTPMPFSFPSYYFVYTSSE